MAKKSKKRKFTAIWASQSDIGKLFGLSAVAVGKMLTQEGLKDPETGEASAKAIEEGWCVETPLRSGIKHFMWSREKVEGLIGATNPRLSSGEIMANEIISVIKKAEKMLAEGDDKMAYMMIQTAFDDIPAALSAQVSEHLKKKNYDRFVDGWLEPPARKARNKHQRRDSLSG